MARGVGVKEAAQIVKTGGVVIYPTDTLWGIGGRADLESVALKVLSIKKIKDRRPFPVVVSSVEKFAQATDLPSRTWQDLVDRFWPGGLTVVVPCKLKPIVAACGQNGMVGFRLPDSDIAVELARACDGYLISTSANITGMPPPLSLSDIPNEVKQSADAWIESDFVASGKPSTVIVWQANAWQIVREGFVPKAELEKVVTLSHIRKADGNS